MADYLKVINAGLDFADFGFGLPTQPRIFIKPNLTFPRYQPGVMTSPTALEAAILAIRERTPHVWVGDSDSGGYNPFSMDDVYLRTGIHEFARRHDVKVVNLSKLERRQLPIQVRGRNQNIGLPRLLLDEIDMLVTMPVPKVHMNTGVSLTYKNQWGCIPEPNDRLRLHPDFGSVVLQVNKAVKAGFAIVDGTYGLNRTGPLRGDAVKLDWILVTNSLGAGARIACELMQIRLRSVGHLSLADDQGIVPPLSEVVVNTDPATFVGPRFYLKREWTDLPGLVAFKSRWMAHLAYFSVISGFLHRLLYLFREPFYGQGST